MQFLRPIISKVLKNSKDAKNAKLLKSDEEIFNMFLKKEVDIELVKKEFKNYYGIGFINIKDCKINDNLLNKFEANALKKENVFPIKEDTKNKVFHFVIGDITDEKSKNVIKKASKEVGYDVVYSFSLPTHINDKFKEIKKTKKVEKIKEEKPKLNELDEKNFNAKDWIEEIINKGIDLKASDIHIEQFEDFVRIRYRVDGELLIYKEYHFSENQLSNINVRLKMISGLDISEKRKPQDGRIDEYEHNDTSYDLRVSSVSTINGEKFTLRLFEKNSSTLTFEELGFSKRNEKIAKEILNSKNGIVYLGGATGSGKTTTLYTMINHRNTDKVNIYTIENPVEKTIDNINQIQINELAGITYVSTLKALLRQDPDIIVVGETRDKETTELSVRSSLTGHLVLTTIHANNAIDSISRVIDMGIEPYLIGASSIGFISQRLVKKLCPHCKEEVTTLEPYQTKWLKDNIKNNKMNVDMNDFKIYKAKGCKKCNDGYKGRVAIVEILKIDDKIRSLIANETDITELKKEVIKDGFEPLVVDGINKVIKGVTSIEEVIKEIS